MTFECVIRAQTDNAYKLDLLMPDKSFHQTWIPRSVIKTITKFPPEANRPQQAIVEFADWWWDKNGI